MGRYTPRSCLRQELYLAHQRMALSPKAEVDVVPGRYGETSRAEMLAFMGGHAFRLTAVETQNEGRQENLSFAADSMAHK